MCLSLSAPQDIIDLTNAAASQTARDAVAVSRTESHALFLCKCFAKKPCTNPITADTRTDDEEEDDDALSVYETLVTFYGRKLL